jgi:hypothetical protein
MKQGFWTGRGFLKGCIRNCKALKSFFHNILAQLPSLVDMFVVVVRLAWLTLMAEYGLQKTRRPDVVEGLIE